MRYVRHVVACIVLVAAYLLLQDAPTPWVYFVPAVGATVAAGLIGRVSLPFVFLVFAFLGPIVILSTLFLVTGTSWPGQAAEHLRAAISIGAFIGILAPPFVGSVTWIAMRYLTIRSTRP
jgi:hypothetical protein